MDPTLRGRDLPIRAMPALRSPLPLHGRMTRLRACNRCPILRQAPLRRRTAQSLRVYGEKALTRSVARACGPKDHGWPLRCRGQFRRAGARPEATMCCSTRRSWTPLPECAARRGAGGAQGDVTAGGAERPENGRRAGARSAGPGGRGRENAGRSGRAARDGPSYGRGGERGGIPWRNTARRFRKAAEPPSRRAKRGPAAERNRGVIFCFFEGLTRRAVQVQTRASPLQRPQRMRRPRRGNGETFRRRP